MSNSSRQTTFSVSRAREKHSKREINSLYSFGQTREREQQEQQEQIKQHTFSERARAWIHNCSKCAKNQLVYTCGINN